MGPGKTHPETGVPVDLPCSVGDKVREVGRRFVFFVVVLSSVVAGVLLWVLARTHCTPIASHGA